jgi:integral membrane protein (TIGR00529 family)
MLLLWFSFVLSLGLMLWIAQRNLWLGLFVGALMLGILNLSVTTLLAAILSVATDPSILLLAMAVGIIPLIGGVLSTTALMDDLISALRIRARYFLILAPAFLGMLPMPGGALLSAPVVARVGNNISSRDYAAINVWFRHVLVMIYPLGGLLATAKMAQMNVYREMVLLIPAFLVMTALGYLFLLRPVDGHLRLNGSANGSKMLIPIMVILIAPVLHLSLMTLLPQMLAEIPLLIGVTCSLLLAMLLGRLKLGDFGALVLKVAPWRYFLIIFGMFTFLRVFERSPLIQVIAGMDFSPTVLVVGVGFLLGALTGRAQLAFSLLLPIYYVKYGADQLTPVAFALMYFAVFMGYVMSPIHPCILVTIEYFKTDLPSFYRRVLVPFGLTFGVLVLSAMVYF